jgi:predicted amidohydrolase
MSGVLRLALAQLLPVWDDAAANLRAVEACASDAAGRGADLVCFPEQVLTGWDPRSVSGAEPVGGSLTQALRACAKREGIAIIGSIREERDGNVMNSAIAVDASGDVAAVYAKQRLFVPGGEDARYAAGGGPALFSCGGMTIGIAICYDLRFPDIFRRYRELGADAIVVPAAWPCGRLRHWRLFLRARALDNRIWTAGISYARGATPVESYCGGSMVADPDGEMTAEAGEERHLLLVDLDREVLVQARSVVDPCRHPAGG